MRSGGSEGAEKVETMVWGKGGGEGGGGCRGEGDGGGKGGVEMGMKGHVSGGVGRQRSERQQK